MLADDQAMVRAGFRMILEAEDDIDVVGEPEDGEKAITATQRWRPDIVLMDVQMPRVDGIEATRRLVAAAGVTSRVLILTTVDRTSVVGFLEAAADQDDSERADRRRLQKPSVEPAYHRWPCAAREHIQTMPTFRSWNAAT